MNFESFNLHPSIMDGVRAMGYVTPTPIQEKAIPPVMQGRDLIGLAQTGTGKTAVFVLPILQRLLSGPRGRVRVLIISPTRELAEQTCAAARDLGKNTRTRSVAIYGGVGMEPQVRRLRSGVEIVVACPGRLLDHLGRGTINLSGLEVVVFDEADRMFDMGFLPDIRRILNYLPQKRQTLLFSATMPNDIRKLVEDVLSDPVTVQIGHTKPATTVAHAFYPVAKHLKTDLLRELLRRTKTDSVLVFTRTKHRAKRLAQQLARAGHRATALQGNMSQNQREASLDGFRDGSYKVLVATDIAARGIDVLDISHVVNFDMPDTADAYTHRIGRTGRIGKNGDAYTLVTSEDDAMVRTIERLLNEPLEKRRLDGFDYTRSAPETPEPRPRQPRASRPPRGHLRNGRGGKVGAGAGRGRGG